MPVVKMPDGVDVQFPDDMPSEQIKGLILQKFPYAAGQQETNTAGQQDREDFSYAGDMVRSLGTGLRSGAESLLGTGGDIREMGEGVSKWAAKKLGAGPETQELVGTIGSYLSPFPGIHSAPTTEQITALSDKYIGDRYQPQSVAGEYARTTGEFAGAGAVTPGGLGRRAAVTLAPTLLSETAGQVTRNLSPEDESMARMVAGIGGSFVGGSGGAKSAINRATKNVPSQKAVSKNRNELYQELRDAGIKYDSNEYGRMAGQLGTLLTKGGFRRRQAPATFDIIDEMLQGAASKKSPDFDDIDGIKQSLADYARTYNPSMPREQAAAAKVLNVLNRFETSAPMINTGNKTAAEVSALTRKARGEALKAIKGRELEKAAKKAESYLSGPESGLKNQVKTLLNSKRGMNLFNDNERALLQEVAGGSAFRNILTSAGKAGFDKSRMANWNTLLPGAAGAATYYGGGQDQDAALKAAMVIGLASGAKTWARRITTRDVQRAIGISRLGKDGQKKLAEMLLTQNGRDKLAKAIVAKISIDKPLEVTVTGDYAANKEQN